MLLAERSTVPIAVAAGGLLERLDGRGADPEQAPFPRRLDLWAYGIFAALALGLEPGDQAKARRTTYKFKDTASVNMSSELCELLAVVVAACLGPEDERVTEPSEIIRYANCLAAAGFPVVIFFGSVQR